MTTKGNTPHGTRRGFTRAVRFLASRDDPAVPVDLDQGPRLTPWNRRGSGPRIAVLRVLTHGFAIGGDTATGIVMTVLTPLIVMVN